jgi:hypothetical protein
VKTATAIHPRQRGSLRRASLAIVALLAVAQVGAFLHFSLVRHAFSSQTSTLVHCGEEAPACPRGQERTPPISRHETCEVFAALHQAASHSACTPSLGAPDFVVQVCVGVPPEGVVVTPWALYLLAPSQPPPAVA